jgi:transcriptional regulator with XRE-family HTH domain
MDDMELGKAIAAMRARAGLSQQALAERAGTSQPAVARLERGGVSPTMAMIERLAAAAGHEVRLELVPVVAVDPVVEAYKRDVDRTLLRENLQKTVDRRLRDMDALREASAEMRRAALKARRAG